MNNDEYEYLLDGSTAGWCLVRNPSGYELEHTIYNTETQAVLLIEDEATHRRVCREMLLRGVKVLESIPVKHFEP